MFRRLADRVFSSNPAEQNVATLRNMGFSEQQARSALQQTNGDVEAAANILLTRGAPSGTSAVAHQYNRQQVEEDELQRALQASMAVPTTNRTKPKVKTAAAVKAGKAALNRVNTPATDTSSRSSSPLQSHPNVKVPKKLSEKSKEEQILRTADRLKSSPQALDTLYKTLKTLQSKPNDPKFRKIDQTTAGYQKSLANAPGAEDLLLAMNFRKSGHKKLTLDFVDQATLYLGISALEQTKLTSEYIDAKSLVQFQKDVVLFFHSADSSTEEAIARSNYMSKLPSEPEMGGAWIFVSFQGLDQKLQRKFDGDDTLDDVLHWIAGNGTQILDKLKSGEWILVDSNRNPPTGLDIANFSSKTLQYIGCWPSGKLEIQPAKQHGSEEMSKNNKTELASARGLAAARSSWVN